MTLRMCNERACKQLTMEYVSASIQSIGDVAYRLAIARHQPILSASGLYTFDLLFLSNAFSFSFSLSKGTFASTHSPCNLFLLAVWKRRRKQEKGTKVALYPTSTTFINTHPLPPHLPSFEKKKKYLFISFFIPGKKLRGAGRVSPHSMRGTEPRDAKENGRETGVRGTAKTKRPQNPTDSY